MWAPELYPLEAPELILWRVSEALDGYSSIGRVGVPEGVFSAMFPVRELGRFDDIFRKQSWYANVNYVDFGRRGGELLLRISLDLNERKIILIINGEEDKLSEIDILLKQILPQIDIGNGGILIDMSYSDKVVVTRAHEGSLR